MKLKTMFYRAAAGALCLLLCVSGLGQTALAAKVPATIPVDKKCSLTIRYQTPSQAATNVEFTVYRVAKVTSELKFNAEGAFAGVLQESIYRLDNQTKWASLARYLVSYLDEANENKNTWKQTVSMGRLAANTVTERTLTDLEPGLYLVVGKPYTRVSTQSNGNLTTTEAVTPTPYLICLPNWEPVDTKGNYDWVRDVTSICTKKEEVESSSVKNIQVAKVWITNGRPRPNSVTVGLYRDGYRVETVTLSAANNWHYVWQNLPVLAPNGVPYDWDVREENVPNGFYTTTDWVNSYNVIITNYSPPPGGGNSNPPGGGTYPPGGGTYPPGGGTYPPGNTPRPTRTPDISIDDPDVPMGNKTPPPVNTPQLSGPPDEIELDDLDVPLGDLPQTGQLWWPVPMLAGAGVLLLLAGLIQHRRGEYDEE